MVVAQMQTNGDRLTNSPRVADRGDGARVPALEREIVQLRAALVNSRQIGVAIGMLAQRFRCPTDRAWALLVRLSQDTNVKAAELARILSEALDGRGRSEDAAVLAAVAARLPCDGELDESEGSAR